MITIIAIVKDKLLMFPKFTNNSDERRGRRFPEPFPPLTIRGAEKWALTASRCDGWISPY
jgi:hypothetical protein